MSIRNTQWVLASRPKGQAQESNFRMVETDLPTLLDGQVLIKVHYLSLDPYMRGRMDESESPSPEGEGFCAPPSAEADVKRGAPRAEAEPPAFKWPAVGGRTRAPR